MPNPLTLRVASTWCGKDADPVEVVTLTLTPEAGGLALRIDAPFHADPGPGTPPGPTWGLWSHEVVELFLLGADGRYTEVELGPHGHHLLLMLEGPRRATRHSLPLAFTTAIEGDRWTGVASIPWAHIPPGPLRANAYAIHGQGEHRRHLAWVPVPGDGPDFHRLAQFQPIEIARP